MSEIYLDPKIINTTYFMLKNSYYNNDKAKIKFYVECIEKMLLNCQKEIVWKALSKDQIQDLKNTLFSIKNNIYYFDFGINNSIVEHTSNKFFDVDQSLWYSSEKELEDAMCIDENVKLLNLRLNTNIKLYDRQFNTNYGKIDILAEDKDTIYIIELKKDVAKHDLVGQVLKYALYFQKRLIYNIFKEIKIVTIAGNYNDYTYDQLKLIGADTVVYSVSNDKLDLHVI